MLTPGEPAPWFTARASINPTYQFDTIAGRYVILCFFGSADHPENRRILAEILAFQHTVSHIERFIVACYDSSSGGHFRKHRDHTTKGTAHRQFAVTINLNAEDYEGGDLRFPEFGTRAYRGPTGSALVFSCCLMHEVTRMTRGKRYAFLPFLFDEEGARIRELNAPFLGAS